MKRFKAIDAHLCRESKGALHANKDARRAHEKLIANSARKHDAEFRLGGIPATVFMILTGIRRVI